MNKKLLFKPVMVIAGTALMATGCVVREEVRYRNPPPPAVVVQPGPVYGEVYVDSEPPPLREEVITVSPDPAFVWIGGGWFWEGRWVWHGGRWGRPPRIGAVWIGPHHVYRGGRHVWVRGHWG